MKMLTAAFGLSLALAGAAVAQSGEGTPGRQLSDLVYGSIVDDPNGAADMGEFVEFGQDIFVSMDYDDSATVTLEEFTAWDFGFTFIADDAGQKRAFETAQKVIFAIWDRDADGAIDLSEYNKALVNDFRRADTDDDAFLTREEFLSGYIVILAYRAAILGQ